MSRDRTFKFPKGHPVVLSWDRVVGEVTGAVVSHGHKRYTVLWNEDQKTGHLRYIAKKRNKQPFVCYYEEDLEPPDIITVLGSINID